MTTITSRRFATLAIGSGVCGLVTGVVVLAVIQVTLRSSDLAYGQPFLHTLLDPFVLTVWIPFTFVPTLIGFVFSLWALRDVQLSKAFPVTLGATVVAAALTAVKFAPASPVVALITALIVMFCCRYYEPWALPPGERGPAGSGAV
jgi:hypothetical protein